jgi:hypothetical protein
VGVESIAGFSMGAVHICLKLFQSTLEICVLLITDNMNLRYKLIDTECSTAMRSFMMYMLHQILSDHQIKEDGISLACSAHGKEENVHKVLLRKLQQKSQIKPSYATQYSVFILYYINLHV